MSEAARKYTEMTGIVPDGVTAIAVGLVWAVEQAPTLLDRVKAVVEVLAAEREACAKICEETFVEPGDMQVESCGAAADKIRARGAT